MEGEGVAGFIYETEAAEDQLIPFPNIPCARLSVTPIKVTGCREIKNAYDLFMEYEAQGKLKVARFEDKTERQLEWWYADLAAYLKEKEMIKCPECPYAVFIKKKLPQVWERYRKTVEK